MLGSVSHYPVAIIGGGQAGLSVSFFLSQRRIDHIVFEKRTAMHSWSTQRWDNFCLVTPNWQCQLPGYPYKGSDPHGFMKKDEIIAYLAGFAEAVRAPIREGVNVELVRSLPEGGFEITTSDAVYTADQVVVASGGYHEPIIPRAAERLSNDVIQIHSAEYRSADQFPPGAVLVVGSGQSGAQIAEDLHLAGRKVHLAVGDAPRCARFYRGRDVVDWLAEMGHYELPVDKHPLRDGVRDNTNHYVTGRDGGRDIDLRKFALEGMELYGRLAGVEGDIISFDDNLAECLDRADEVYNSINAAIDKHIATEKIDAPPASVYKPLWQPLEHRTRLSMSEEGIAAVIWCIGFRPDFGWLDAPVFNGRGAPVHTRGVTCLDGLYFVGLPWLHTWGSGRFSGVARDALYLADAIDKFQRRLDAAIAVRA